MKEVFMHQRFYDMIEQNPVIAAVKNDEGLDRCCSLEEIQVVFILYGNICTIKEIVVITTSIIAEIGSRRNPRRITRLSVNCNQS